MQKIWKNVSRELINKAYNEQIKIKLIRILSILSPLTVASALYCLLDELQIQACLFCGFGSRKCFFSCPILNLLQVAETRRQMTRLPNNGTFTLHIYRISEFLNNPGCDRKSKAWYVNKLSPTIDKYANKCSFNCFQNINDNYFFFILLILLSPTYLQLFSSFSIIVKNTLLELLTLM